MLCVWWYSQYVFLQWKSEFYKLEEDIVFNQTSSSVEKQNKPQNQEPPLDLNGLKG